MIKVFKFASTLMILVGISFLYMYVRSQSEDHLHILSRPSYYIIQNYWYVFLAGIIVVAFSLLGSFFSWFKKLDNLEEIIPNAGYVSEQDISTLVGVDTVNLDDKTEILTKQSDSYHVPHTEILHISASKSQKNHIVSEPSERSRLSVTKTEILHGENKQPDISKGE